MAGIVVLETSALMAVFLSEEDASAIKLVLAGRGVVLPASCLLEASASVRRKGRDPVLLGAFVKSLRPAILPFDARQARIAVDADRRFGRDTRHPARLNFGDCMSYAAAIALDAPLLFKGDDFARTDVKRASP